jgi:hypothetical protein
MKTHLAYSPRLSQPEDSLKIKVTVFYPDATCAAHLVAALHRALKELGEDDALDLRPWRLDILEWPEMQAQATQDVACSDVVVVPSDAAYAGSAFFPFWAEAWPAALDGRRLLLVPRRGVPDTAQRQQFVQWLQGLAARKGMDFVHVETGEAAAPYLPAQGREEAATPVRKPVSAYPPRGTQEVYRANWQPLRESRYGGLNE